MVVMIFYANFPVEIKSCFDILQLIEQDEWVYSVFNVPKLCTYVTLKQELCTAGYVKGIIFESHRSIFTKYWCGILP